MLRSFTIAILGVLLAVATAIRSAQEEPTARFEGLVEVTEVLLDVLALDKKGNVVHGLGKDDFIVVQDGKPVELTGVSFYTTRYGESEGPPAAAEEPPEPGEATVEVPPEGDKREIPPEGDKREIPPEGEIPSSRFFVLFFHQQRFGNTLLGYRQHQGRQAGRHAHDWVRDAMSPSDWVAVVSHRARLYIHQDFTQDRASLMAAIVEASRGILGKDPKPAEWERAAAASPFALRRGLPSAVDLRRETRVTYDAIRLVAEATRPIVGRKNLLLFSLGFGELDEFTFDSQPDRRYYPAMKEALNDNNVALYPIDTTHPDVTSSQARFLLRLAIDSGGLYVPNHVNFKARLDRIAQENAGYYLLSFQATHPAGESGYRTVRVSTKARHVQLRARRGYRYGH